jgi:hypothetical protein
LLIATPAISRLFIWFSQLLRNKYQKCGRVKKALPEKQNDAIFLLYHHFEISLFSVVSLFQQAKATEQKKGILFPCLQAIFRLRNMH